ncbi:hypothetical protein ALC56_00272 [Trachymyrmex septentrionalis]|uniref:Uncharacterized protein n=1 Tax=Trachymyrmex septentrionalis TaxID=34720 RepID=A0A151K1I5_9HYME|nr:hypothetical protein ALC56_00272 [Trachymyrmex septentrionalis]
MSEIWLKPHVPDSFVDLHGLNTFSFFRISTKKSFYSQKSLLFTIVYSLPKLGHLFVFQADFEKYLLSYFVAMIIGDINIDLNQISFESGFLRNFCSNHLFITLFSNTHHTSSSHSWIDHCFIRDQSLLLQSSSFPF